MNQDTYSKTSKCGPCIKIDLKNLKPVIPSTYCPPPSNPLKNLLRSFTLTSLRRFTLTSMARFIIKKIRKLIFLHALIVFLTFPIEKFMTMPMPIIFLKIFQNYILLHGVPRQIRFDQARCQIGKQITNLCEQYNIEVITALINDDRAIGLVERLIQTIKRRLRC